MRKTVPLLLGLCLFSPLYSIDFEDSSNILEPSEVICHRKTIWRWDELPKLRNCSVIEGSLEINIIIDSNPENLDISSISFPFLKEITGFLMLFSTQGLTTLNQLFPKLTLIRGQELVEDYALVIYKMHDLEEINLPSLTDIAQGGVWIVENEKLCFVDTIDWSLIIRSEGHLISRRNGEGCPPCPENCESTPSKHSQKAQRLCWSGDECQYRCPYCVLGTTCVRRVRDNGGGKCCDPQCVGGCTGGLGKDNCHVCKRVRISGKNDTYCEENCPKGFYKYLDRRCVSSDECTAIRSPAPKNHPKYPKEGILRGKLYKSPNQTHYCVLDCPVGSRANKRGDKCLPCVAGICDKPCDGGNVDTIEAARKLSGCTRVQGHLKVHIRAQSQSTGSLTTVAELTKNLGQIEVIDDFLLVSHTFALYSLDFLKSLKTIRGNVLSDNRHALVVKSNENMEDLWSSRNITIENLNATVLFHYNPKLCPRKIYQFLESSGLNVTTSHMDIGITNGDKVSCNTKTLFVKVLSESETSTEIQWENFARNLTEPSFLLNYEVHYKPTLHENEMKLALRDPCGQDGWYILDQSPYRYSGRVNDTAPPMDEPLSLDNLQPFTKYAFYVKAIVLPSTLYALNSDMGAESEIKYFQTRTGTPEKPANLQLTHGPSPDTILVNWQPPSKSNGPLHFYRLTVGIEHLPNLSNASHVNYCDGNFTKPFTRPRILDEDEVMTRTSTTPTLKPRLNGYQPNPGSLEETKMLDIILGNHLFPGVDATPQEQIVRRRRRKRDASNFLNWSKMNTSKKDFPINPGKTLYQEVLSSLKHYTWYYVGIQACRRVKDGETICSKTRPEWIRTLPDPDADLVTNISAHYVNSTLLIQWEKPSSPNGQVLAYHITVKKLVVNGTGAEWPQCISREDFTHHTSTTPFFYKYPDSFPKGNYSVRMQTMSHAQTSAFSTPVYFHVQPPPPSLPVPEGVLTTPPKNDSNPKWLWLLFPLALLLLGFGTMTLVFLRKRRHHAQDKQRTTSANPAYSSPVEIPPQWETLPKDLIVYRDTILGVGSFGTVYQGTFTTKSNPKSNLKPVKIPCAVKELSKDNQLAQLLEEALRMTKLNCPHVIKLLGIVSHGRPILVVMEFMKNRDLRSYLEKVRPNLEMSELFSMAVGIADGMAYIHSKGFVHRDLAARNVLLDDRLKVKVGDFGLSRELLNELGDYYKMKSVAKLPVRWMAPECFTHCIFTQNSDVWSFGVVLWEMMTWGGIPYPQFPGTSENLRLVDFVLKQGTLEMPKETPQVLAQIAQECWTFREDRRPSFLQILERLMPIAYSKEFELISFYHSKERKLGQIDSHNDDNTRDTSLSDSEVSTLLEPTSAIGSNMNDNLQWEMETAQIQFHP